MKGWSWIEGFVTCHNRVEVCLRLHHFSSEDPSREIALVRNEIDGSVERALYLGETLHDLWDMLMLESLVDADVAWKAPGEMRRRSWLHTGSRRARDGINTDIALDESQLSSGEQTELDAGREAARVGDMHR